MKAKLSFLYLFFCFSSFSQNTNTSGNNFFLNGKISGIDSGKMALFFRKDVQSWEKDTVSIVNGEFLFSGKISQPTMCGLMTVGEDNFASIFIDPGHQKIILKNGDFYHFKMYGSYSQRQADTLQNQLSEPEQSNLDLGSHIDSLNSIYLAEKDTVEKQHILDSIESLRGETYILALKHTAIIKDFIRSHPGSYVSGARLEQLISEKLDIDGNEAKVLYNNLENNIKESISGKLIQAQLKKWDLIKPGVQIPDINAVDITGKSFQLSSLKDKYILIDFWASWCIPCRKEIPHLKELYQQYKTDGLAIVFISLDNKKINWENAVQKENLESFVNLLVNKKMKDSVINTQSPIPNQILIDKNHLIIWNSIYKEGSRDLDTEIKNTLR
ncbi:MAG: AhpC/TSA family protein [Bacteroidetes bacterium]|nr:AhpC/TSA family protein [Bacteroidota bacterium]